MSFQKLILISALCFATHSEAKWKYDEHAYIVDSLQISNPSPEEVHLVCNVSGNASVYWRKNNAGHHFSGKINVTEPKDAGNFTCWDASSNKLLNYVNLYVAKITYKGGIKLQTLQRKESSNSALECTANNYSGNFTCSWMITPESQNRSPKFAVRIQNTYIDDSSGTITCTEPMRDSAIPRRYFVECKKQKPCISTEEYQQTEIALHLFDRHTYENDTLKFFIKDILKPDATECEIIRNEKSGSYQIAWNPPKTWSTPISYFGLDYQIKTSGTKEKICYVDNPLENGNRLSCNIRRYSNKQYFIRSKDHYNNIWSEWSNPCSAEPQKYGQNHHAFSAEPQKYGQSHQSETKIVPCNCWKN